MHIVEALLLVALVALGAEARAVAREDVKGIKTLPQDEAHGDVFFDHNPQYDFAYRIHDEETGDAKDQTEERRGDAVQGSYSVVDPDGTLRVVRYTADDANGFNAIVSLTPGHSKPIVPAVKPFLQQQRFAVVQNHVDVPVPVQHHVLTSSSANVGNRRVLVEHPQHQSGAQLQQHIVQPPLALGVHQDVHHLIPQAGFQLQQLQQLQQIQGAGIQTPAMPLIPVQDQGIIKQEMPLPVLQIQQQANVQQAQALLNQQQEQGILKQQEAIQAAFQQQILQQGEQNVLQQEPDDTPQQSSSVLEEQQDNKLQQQNAESSLPQVIEVRHTVQPAVQLKQQQPLQQLLQSQQAKQLLQQQPLQLQQELQQEQQLQLRSLDSEEQVQQLQQQVQQQVQRVQQVQQPFQHQRTLAVYRSSPSPGGIQGVNFIRFSSPYAQYTIS